MVSECASGITAPRGFSASGTHSGIKRVKKDLALVFSEAPAHAAGVFTTSKVQAAPVLVCKQQLKQAGPFRAIVVNSGNANACTGERGLNDAWTMVETVARASGIGRNEVLVSSTGVIGQYLPMEKITSAIPDAFTALSAEGHLPAAEAIMTTDTFYKEIALRLTIDDIDVTIGGMAKGSGMIAPNMATMLAFISTDAAISTELLNYSLKRAADRSFNRITVDGDTSTNDTVVAMASGQSGQQATLSELTQAFAEVCQELAEAMVRDGEGTSHVA
jgi:glutamate N-acetyltransferase/amino-acid N-acetyltransferase